MLYGFACQVNTKITQHETDFKKKTLWNPLTISAAYNVQNIWEHNKKTLLQSLLDFCCNSAVLLYYIRLH